MIDDGWAERPGDKFQQNGDWRVNRRAFPGGLRATADDLADLVPVDGCLPVGAVVPDPARLAELAAAPDRRDWWINRVRDCYPLLASRP